MRRLSFAGGCCLMMLLTSASLAANPWGLKEGTPDIKSANVLTFGPDGILFVGDAKSAAVFAIATESGKKNEAGVEVDALNDKLKAALKTDSNVVIRDLAANPANGSIYLSVAVRGQDTSPNIVHVDADGKLSVVSFEGVKFAKASLPNAPEDKAVQRGRRRRNPRNDSITDLAWVDGKVLVSGLSDKGSNVRSIPFPFSETGVGTTVEIYHGAHGRYEDYAAIRTFVPFTIDGEPTLLASYVCTPLVKFPVADLKAGERTRGTTVAELGNRNRPLDMLVYKKDGKDFVLLANQPRGVMKISTEDIATNDIKERVSGGGTAGQKYETIDALKGVVQMDRFNDTHVVVLVQSDSGQSLKTIGLP